MVVCPCFLIAKRVALLAEGVDRNTHCCDLCACPRIVALLAEGVDRNIINSGYRTPWWKSPSSRRAWIEIDELREVRARRRSPSSRRAWIEIYLKERKQPWKTVALLAEGVDRNLLHFVETGHAVWSPSSRRAWIEMLMGVMLIAPVSPSPSSRRAWIEIWEKLKAHLGNPVALLAEGVDRNVVLLHCYGFA